LLKKTILLNSYYYARDNGHSITFPNNNYDNAVNGAEHAILVTTMSASAGVGGNKCLVFGPAATTATTSWQDDAIARGSIL